MRRDCEHLRTMGGMFKVVEWIVPEWNHKEMVRRFLSYLLLFERVKDSDLPVHGCNICDQVTYLTYYVGIQLDVPLFNALLFDLVSGPAGKLVKLD